MKSYLATGILLMMYMTSTAQRICATEDYVKNHFVLQSKTFADASKLPPRDTFPNEIITIPVVVHVLFKSTDQNISTDQVLSQIEVLNKDFRLLNADKSLVPSVFKNVSADSRIMFCLAKVDPEGHATSGINRKYTAKDYFMADDGMKFKAKGGVDAWDTHQYLNIWVCSIFGRVLGYATPPGGDETKDGVVINFDVFGTKGRIRADFNKGRTATHEVAHWLGLKHIWGDDFCGDDGVDDTPRQKSYNYYCPDFPSTTDCSQNASGDMFMNFMDLTSDACMNMFTQGQKMRMRSLFALGASRNGILRSYQCDSSQATSGPLPQDTIPKVAPADIISVYPNPVADVVTVHAKQLQTLKGKSAILLSSTGKIIFEQVLQSNNDKIRIGHLPAGLYLLSIGDKGSKTNFKLVKL
jgi:hypothetical protein